MSSYSARLRRKRRQQQLAQQRADEEKAMSEAYEPGTVITNQYGVYRVKEVKPYSGRIWYSCETLEGKPVSEMSWSDFYPDKVALAEVGSCSECSTEFYNRDDYMCEPCRTGFDTEYERTLRVSQGDTDAMNPEEYSAFLEQMRQEAMQSGYEKAIGRA